MISRDVPRVSFTGRFMHGETDEYARLTCLKAMERYAVRKGYPRVPPSWVHTHRELIDEYFFKYTVEAYPPTTATAYWLNGKKYEKDPFEVKDFSLGFQDVGTPYVSYTVAGYHPEDGCPVMKLEEA